MSTKAGNPTSSSTTGSTTNSPCGRVTPPSASVAFAEALELARNGNEHAQLHLRRIVRIARTPEQAQRALEALGEG